MNNTWRVKAILSLLSGLPIKDAHTILFQAKQRLEVKNIQVEAQANNCANAYRQPRTSKIDSDPELRDFILSMPYMPQDEILRACRNSFGDSRAPSRSGLSRFLTKLRKTK